MFANTKQVRAVGNAVMGFGAQWTEKTSKYNKQRRSVTWMVFGSGEAAAKDMRAAFAAAGYTNKVKATGGCYVRVIADLA